MFTLITSCKDVTSCLSFLATEETPQRVHQAGNMKQQDTQKNVPRQNDCHRTKNPARQLDSIHRLTTYRGRCNIGRLRGRPTTLAAQNSTGDDGPNQNYISSEFCLVLSDALMNCFSHLLACGKTRTPMSVAAT